MSDAWGGSFGIAWGSSWGIGAPPPPPVVLRQAGSTIGGISEWQIQIPRIPEKKLPVFTRNMENQDRADIGVIVEILRRNGWL